MEQIMHMDGDWERRKRKDIEVKEHKVFEEKED